MTKTRKQLFQPTPQVMWHVILITCASFYLFFTNMLVQQLDIKIGLQHPQLGEADFGSYQRTIRFRKLVKYIYCAGYLQNYPRFDQKSVKISIILYHRYKLVVFLCMHATFKRIKQPLKSMAEGGQEKSQSRKINSLTNQVFRFASYNIQARAHIMCYKGHLYGVITHANAIQTELLVVLSFKRVDID